MAGQRCRAEVLLGLRGFFVEIKADWMGSMEGGMEKRDADGARELFKGIFRGRQKGPGGLRSDLATEHQRPVSRMCRRLLE